MLRKLSLVAMLACCSCQTSKVQAVPSVPPAVIKASVKAAAVCKQHIVHIANLCANWIMTMGHAGYVYVDAFLRQHGPEVTKAVREILKQRGM